MDSAAPQASEPHTNSQTVTVTCVVDRPVDSVWAVLMTDDGASALLGDGGRLGNKGETWRATDGSYGITRSFHPLEQIRFSWHASAHSPATLVDLHLRASGAGTELEIVHDHLPDDAELTSLQAHWRQALDRITQAAQ